VFNTGIGGGRVLAKIHIVPVCSWLGGGDAWVSFGDVSGPGEDELYRGHVVGVLEASRGLAFDCCSSIRSSISAGRAARCLHVYP